MRTFISIIFSCVLLLQCGFGQTVVQGKLKSLVATDLRLVCNQNVLNDYQGETLADGKTDANGIFYADIKLTTEQTILLFIGNKFYKLWLVPNTTLSVTETGEGQLYFTGETAVQNTFLYRAGITTPMAVPAAITSATFEPQKQLRYLDSIEEKRWLQFQQNVDLKRVSAQFVNYCKAEITHFSILNKSQYLLQHIYGANKIKREEIPAGYYSFWNNFKTLDSCTNDSYFNSLRDYIGYLASKQLGIFNAINDKEKYYQTEFSIADSLLATSTYTSERLKAGMVLFLMKYVDLPQLIQLQISNYISQYPSSDYSVFIGKKWAQKRQHELTKPSFSLKDTSGRFVDIASLRGSVVYIDFWGSWCKPCMEQMNNSKIVQQKFKDKRVVFAFINFYDSNAKWLQTISSKQLTGIHLKAEKKDLAFFEATFGVGQGFPRYALLDKNGWLITTSAPHPNDEAAVELIEKYLN